MSPACWRRGAGCPLAARCRWQARPSQDTTYWRRGGQDPGTSLSFKRGGMWYMQMSLVGLNPRGSCISSAHCVELSFAPELSVARLLATRCRVPPGCPLALAAQAVSRYHKRCNYLLLMIKITLTRNNNANDN